MAYMHIDNLYKADAQDILLFHECYALEKIHGTSANILWDGWVVNFFSGGEKRARFIALFDHIVLRETFEEMFGIDGAHVTIYGEAYGGKCQGMSATYGKELRFIAFEVKVGDVFLSVPQAADVVKKVGLEFVHYDKCPTDLTTLDNLRDALSCQAIRNGMGAHPREGIVLRPLIELRKNNGSRIIVKHKGEAFRERTSIPEVDPAKREKLIEARAIADEWVTEMRLTHVLDALNAVGWGMRETGRVIEAMTKDVIREAGGEITNAKDVRKAIGQRAAKLFKARVTQVRATSAD